MNRQKVIGWAVAIFFAWYLITDPHGAAQFVTGALNALKGVGNSLSQFLTSL